MQAHRYKKFLVENWGRISAAPGYRQIYLGEKEPMPTFAYGQKRDAPGEDDVLEVHIYMTRTYSYAMHVEIPGKWSGPMQDPRQGDWHYNSTSPTEQGAIDVAKNIAQIFNYKQFRITKGAI